MDSYRRGGYQLDVAAVKNLYYKAIKLYFNLDKDLVLKSDVLLDQELQETGFL